MKYYAKPVDIGQFVSNTGVKHDKAVQMLETHGSVETATIRLLSEQTKLPEATCRAEYLFGSEPLNFRACRKNLHRNKQNLRNAQLTISYKNETSRTPRF